MESDETYGAALLRPLDRDPHPQSTVDIRRAMVDGERHQRRIRLASSGAAALVVALILVGGWAVIAPERGSRPLDPATLAPPPPASASPSPGPHTPAPPTSCTLQRLPVPAGQPPKSVVTGADPTGRYILGRSYPGNSKTPHVLIWDNGQVGTVSMDGDDQRLLDITSTGVAVGTSYVGKNSDQTAAWVYRNGKTTRLADGVAEAYAINEREVIVGSVNGKPAMWHSPTSQPTMLATPGAGWQGYAAGIDEDGTIVGRLSDADDLVDLGYLWRPDGTVQQLTVPTLQGSPVTTYTANSIRDGWALGWAALDQATTRHIGTPRWNLRTGEVETTSFTGIAEDINRYGWIVGESSQGAAVVADGKTVPLPDLGSNSRPGGTIPYTISDDGTIVAGQVDLPGGEPIPVAVSWSCR